MSLTIKLLLIFIQSISAKILGLKNNYINAPSEILADKEVTAIYQFRHFLPSLVLSILIAVKLIPLLSPEYALQLEDNASIIPIAFCCCFFPILIINGIILEKSLMNTKPEYKNYVLGKE